MRRLFVIFMLLAVMGVIAYAGTYQRVKAKLTTYVDNQGFSVDVLKGLTKEQVNAWADNNAPRINKKAIWVALQEIIREKEEARVKAFMISIAQSVRSVYPDATYRYDQSKQVITIYLVEQAEEIQ